MLRPRRGSITLRVEESAAEFPNANFVPPCVVPQSQTDVYRCPVLYACARMDSSYSLCLDINASNLSLKT